MIAKLHSFGHFHNVSMTFFLIYINFKLKHTTHQSLFSRLSGGDREIVAFGVEGIDLDTPVGFRLPQPHSKHLLHIDALPRLHACVHVDLQRTYSHVPSPIFDRHESRYLQEHRCRLISWAQVHPELRPYNAARLDLWAEGEKTALRFLVYLNVGVGYKRTRERTGATLFS